MKILEIIINQEIVKNTSTVISIEKENEILINDEVFKIESIYKKGNLFRKEKWVYIITFPNGTKKELK